jgi:hypothetical protein
MGLIVHTLLLVVDAQAGDLSQTSVADRQELSVWYVYVVPDSNLAQVKNEKPISADRGLEQYNDRGRAHEDSTAPLGLLSTKTRERASTQ